MSDNAQDLQVTYIFSASAERVFDAWLNPAKAKLFLFATDTGTMVRADIDARVGGEFNFVDRRDGVDVLHTGTYLEIDRPKRLRFTFAVPMYSSEFTDVVIDIEPRAHGCSLTLTQKGTLPEWRDRTIHGWTTILSKADSLIA